MDKSDEKKIVTLPVLKFYDETIKKWVLDKLSSSEIPSGGIIFNRKSDFPTQGISEVLYVDTLGSGIYIWDNEYKNLTLNMESIDEKINSVFESISSDEINSLFK